MKYLIAGVVICFAACHAETKEADLTGQYVTNYQNEFYAGGDTLVVSKANKGKDVYTIVRRTGISKDMKADTPPTKIVIDTWTLEYNPEKQTLFELRQGKTLVWDAANKTIQLGNRLYKRVS